MIMIDSCRTVNWQQFTVCISSSRVLLCTAHPSMLMCGPVVHPVSSRSHETIHEVPDFLLLCTSDEKSCLHSLPLVKYLPFTAILSGRHGIFLHVINTKVAISISEKMGLENKHGNMIATVIRYENPKTH